MLYTQFTICISSLVFTVKELEKLPNLKVESPPKEIAELNRRGTTNWQCEPKGIRELCEETLQKVRHRVEERRILLKQFFKDYDRSVFVILYDSNFRTLRGKIPYELITNYKLC